jgi:hypothetical protein
VWSPWTIVKSGSWMLPPNTLLEKHAPTQSSNTDVVGACTRMYVCVCVDTRLYAYVYVYESLL